MFIQQFVMNSIDSLLFSIRARLELSKNILRFIIDPPWKTINMNKTCLKLENMFVHMIGQSHVFLSPINIINKLVYCLKHGLNTCF
jgi:hypothetical protein